MTAGVNVTKEGIEVKVGQVWRDLDKRMGGRLVKVTGVQDGVAIAGVCSRVNFRIVTSSRTRLSIRRMHKSSTGWALVPEANE